MVVSWFVCFEVFLVDFGFELGLVWFWGFFCVVVFFVCLFLFG